MSLRQPLSSWRFLEFWREQTKVLKSQCKTHWEHCKELCPGCSRCWQELKRLEQDLLISKHNRMDNISHKECTWLWKKIGFLSTSHYQLYISLWKVNTQECKGQLWFVKHLNVDYIKNYTFLQLLATPINEYQIHAVYLIYNNWEVKRLCLLVF